MPSLYGAGFSLHLATQPLAASLTEKVDIKKGYAAASKSEHAEKALVESAGSLLPEERVPFPGDEGNFMLNWLGGVPFSQVVVRRPSARSQHLATLKQKLALTNAQIPVEDGRRASQRISARSGRMLYSDEAAAENDSANEALPSHGLPLGLSPSESWSNSLPKYEALILHVNLSDKTFFQDPFDMSPQHLKIEVFFNGKLSNCVLIHAKDVQTGVKSFNPIFAGTRVDYMVERPWIIQAPSSGVGSDHHSAGSPAQDRWVDICKALMAEANERGIDGNGERPPTAAFLQELASMHMPDSINDMQKPGGLKFGVIDVIVSVGSGRKFTAGAEYLKAPTRLPDERYSYPVNEENDFQLIRTAPAANGTTATDAADLDAEGDSDAELPVLPPTTAHHGLPDFRGQAHQPGSSQPITEFHDPFTGSPIPSLPSFQPSTSYIRQNPYQTEAGGPLQKRGRPEVAYPFGTHIGAFQQPSPPRRVYPSAHGPSLPMSSAFPRSLPRTEFNVNQYDSFEHANPYQVPYAGIISGFSFGSFDGPPSSPLRDTPSGRSILPTFLPSPEEVIPSMNVTNNHSSPYIPDGSLPNLTSGFSSYGSIAPGTDLSTFGTRSFPLPNVAPHYPPQGLCSSTFTQHGHFGSTASDLYIPAQGRSPKAAPPPMAFFKVTEQAKTNLPTAPGLKGRKPSGSVIPLDRVVIRKGKQIVRSHFFTTPQTLARKPHLVLDTTMAKDKNVNPNNGPSANPGRVEQPEVRRRSTRAKALETPPGTSPSELVDLTTVNELQKTKRDSIHDASMNVGVIKPVEAAPIPTMTRRGYTSDFSKTSVSTKPIYSTDDYTIMHRTAATGILGVQGPKANVFVMDNPEELLRKKKSKPTAQSGSISPTKVDTAPREVVDGPVQTTASRKVDFPVDSSNVHTGSSSPLSELSHSPDLGFTLETPVHRNSAAQTDTFVSGPPVASSALELLTSALVSTAASAPSAPPASSMTSQQGSSAASASISTSLKRKGVPDELQKPGRTGPYTKPLRSPDRWDAKSNLALNQDSVIQYAVSEREGGALRQVRSERKGAFKEETVVVGVRFFVPGC